MTAIENKNGNENLRSIPISTKQNRENERTDSQKVKEGQMTFNLSQKGEVTL